MKNYYIPQSDGLFLIVEHGSTFHEALKSLTAEKKPVFLTESDPSVLAYLASQPSTKDFQMQAANNMRGELIDATDPLAIRHMRQELRFTAPEMDALAKKGKALTLAQFKELEAYTQALRDLPTTLKTWPAVTDAEWPKKPAFMDKPTTQGV